MENTVISTTNENENKNENVNKDNKSDINLSESTNGPSSINL